MFSYVDKRNRSINTSPIRRTNQWLIDRDRYTETLRAPQSVSVFFFNSQVSLHLHAIHPKLGRSGYAYAFRIIINWFVVDFTCGTSDRRIKLYDQRIVPHSNASLHCHVMCQCVDLYYGSSFVIDYDNGLGFRLVDCGSSVSDHSVAVTLSRFFYL